LKEKTVLLAGGGTGGHLVPALAIAQALEESSPGLEVVLAVTSRPIDRRICSGRPYATMVQPVHPLRNSPLGLVRFAVGLRAGLRQMAAAMNERNVGVVVGLGGYGSFPAVWVGKGRVPTAMLNPDAVPGKANRFLAGRVGMVFAQWEVSRQYLKHCRSVQVTGCPLKREMAQAATVKREGGQAWQQLRTRAYEAFRLEPDRLTLLVTGASQGARNVNQAMGRLVRQLARFNDRWQILHQTGAGQLAATQQLYRRFCSLPYRLLEFCDRMELAYSAADVVVCRAGAVTLAEVTAMGLPAVMLPYPYHRDQHQRRNAEVLAGAGAGVLVVDEAENVERTSAQLYEALIPLISDEEARRRYSQCSQALGKLDAAKQIAQWIVNELEAHE